VLAVLAFVRERFPGIVEQPEVRRSLLSGSFERWLAAMAP
jgi:hypothetical protein